MNEYGNAKGNHAMRITRLLPHTVVLVAACATAARGASTYARPTVYLEVRADEEDALYRVGEKITFSVTAYTCTLSGNNAVKAKNARPVAGVQLKYEITGDGGMKQTGDLVSSRGPVTIETKLDRPGFVLCAVHEATLDHWWQYRGRGGAGVEPLKIKAGVTKPADFDAFWKAQLDRLHSQPIEIVYSERVPNRWHADKIDQFKIKVSSPGTYEGNHNPYVTGWLTKPKNARARAHPAALHLPGAGVRSPNPSTRYITNMGFIELTISVHGFDAGKDRDYYRTTARNEMKSWPKNGGTTRAEWLVRNYERVKFLRVIQALRYLKAQPEWDHKTLVVSGGSQGGGLSLIAAALDPDVTACIACFPGYCDQYGHRQQHADGWPGMARLGKDGKPVDPIAYAGAAYFDAAVFARNITADTVVTTGFIDKTVPPSTVYAAYNPIPARHKQIINGVTNGHEGPRWDSVAFLKNHMKRLARR